MERPVGERRHRSDPEDPSNHGGTLERRLLVGIQQVDSAGENRLDRVGNGQTRWVALDSPPLLGPHQEALIDELTKDLFDEERIALGPAEHRRSQLLSHRRQIDQRVEQRRRRIRRERTNGQLPTDRSIRVSIEEGGSSCAEDQHWSLDAARNVVQQVEQSRIGPVEILEHDQHRSISGEAGQQHPPCCTNPGCNDTRWHLGDSILVCDIEGVLETGDCVCSLGGIVEEMVHQLFDLGSNLRWRVSLEGPHLGSPDVGDRAKGEFLSKREAAALEDRGLIRLPVDELRYQATLPDPGVADDRDHASQTVISHRPEFGRQRFETLVTTHQRCADELGLTSGRGQPARQNVPVDGFEPTPHRDGPSVLEPE